MGLSEGQNWERKSARGRALRVSMVWLGGIVRMVGTFALFE